MLCPALTVPLLPLPAVGMAAMRALICEAMVLKADSTLTDVLADVSRNPIPSLSANLGVGWGWV